jgi:hypothetical protein
MSKYTCDSWCWVFRDEACTIPIAIDCAGFDVITFSEDAGGPRAYVDPEAMSLIEAAPDLLAACKTVLAKLDYLVELWSEEGITRGVQDQLRAAIAKAEPNPIT